MTVFRRERETWGSGEGMGDGTGVDEVPFSTNSHPGSRGTGVLPVFPCTWIDLCDLLKPPEFERTETTCVLGTSSRMGQDTPCPRWFK